MNILQVEEGSGIDDKTTITEGDEIYEDDWEEDSDKADSENKSAERDNTTSNTDVPKEGN